MTACRAWMASVAMADTRAWSTVPVPRSFWAKRSVADRPEPAAVGLISVGAVMVSSCVVAVGWVASLQGPAASVRVAVGQGGPSSAVLAEVRELVGIDLD